ncbi:MAG TPA: carbohydrate kinase family protein [Candidatus Babeliales bacterium]|nr:carbohydrate kinase family protein [Candidatus Babeliales bacterium]
MKLLTIGGATYDIIIEFTQAEVLARQTATGKQSFLLLEEGRKLNVDDVHYKTGGGATNSAVTFARLGFDVSTFFKIGTDYQGTFILETLKQEGVDTHLARTTDLAGTSTSFIVSNPSGDRTILVYRGASKTISEQELPLQEIKESDCSYITSLSGNAMQLLPIITQQAKKYNRTVAVNPGINQLKEGVSILESALPTIDILILNSFEATVFMTSMVQHDEALRNLVEGASAAQPIEHYPKLLQAPIIYQALCFNLPLFFNRVLGYGTKMVVVTNGSEGVYVATNKEILFHPSIPTEVISTLGAGDAFGSGFVAGIMQGNSIDDAIRWGVLNSCGVLRFLDAKTGLLTKDEMAKQLKQLDKGLLQKFNIE